MNVKLIDGKPFLITNYKHVCEHHACKPDNEVLEEATYKEIQMFIDNDFLKQKVRANALEGVRHSGFEDHAMYFDIKSSLHKDNNITYSNVVKFNDWDAFIDETEYNPIERARLLMLSGDLMLHCTCPSFLFWGYQYLLTQIDAAVVPEERPPVKRNPQQRGIVCKHLNRTLRSWPFFTSDFARYIRQNHDTQKGKDKTKDKQSEMTEEAFTSKNDNIVYEDLIKWNTIAKRS